MFKVILQSDSFGGWIDLIYNEVGILYEFKVCSVNITQDCLLGVMEDLKHFRYFTSLEAFIKETGLYRYRKAGLNLSFERWWVMFDNQRDRKDTLGKWKLFKDNKTKIYKVFVGTKGYLRWCMRNPGCPKMSPCRFLVGEHYMTDWDKAEPFSKTQNETK